MEDGTSDGQRRAVVGGNLVDRPREAHMRNAEVLPAPLIAEAIQHAIAASRWRAAAGPDLDPNVREFIALAARRTARTEHLLELWVCRNPPGGGGKRSGAPRGVDGFPQPTGLD